MVKQLIMKDFPMDLKIVSDKKDEITKGDLKVILRVICLVIT